MDFKKLKNEKGITLIALAVTIVVLLILAGVTISSVFSENGIIERAKKAQETINEAQKNDLAELEKLAEQMEKYTNSNDTVGVDLSEYATLNLQSYVGRYSRQKCDYIKMYVEISNADNSEDKITYAIGTDWKENVVKENDNNTKLFLKNNSELEMIRVNKNDPKYSAENLTMSSAVINGFTDVKISNLYVKKGHDYNVKICVGGANNKNGIVNNFDAVLYEGTTGDVSGDLDVILDKTKVTIKGFNKLWDISGDSELLDNDATALDSIIWSGVEGLTKYTSDEHTSQSSYTRTCIPLLDEKGNIINEIANKYIGFDLNRDGCIDFNDSALINECKQVLGGRY